MRTVNPQQGKLGCALALSLTDRRVSRPLITMITGCFLFCSEWFGFCLVYYLYCSYNACSCHPLSVTVSMGLHCYFFSEICVMSRRPKSSSVSSSACGSGTVPESRPLLLAKSQTMVRSCPALGHARILCPSRSSLGASQGAKTRGLGAR